MKAAAAAAASSASPVDAAELQYVKLYKERRPARRLDVFPFLILYGAWIYYQAEALLRSDKETSSFSFGKVSLICLGVLHALVYLFTVWSVSVRCLVRYSRCRRLEDATLVEVVPHAFTGSKTIVPLEQSTVGGEQHIGFSFRKLRFLWHPQDGTFRKLAYPSRLTFAEYRASSGYGREAAIEAALDRWGPNRFEVPVPTFWELLQEQLLAPFFCFQVFCVALWALDEFWYYSVFTLFMLISFESTVVFQRQRNLHHVRALQQPRQPLKAYRCGRWADLPGDALVPGDVVSVARPQGGEEVVVQADMLLLAGSCIVDEGVLTGESTPQWKNPVGEASGDEVDASEVPAEARLSVKRDKMHVVFGGTKLMQATGDKEAHIRTPDGGCLAVVLRTGFGTAQGRLMRTILYSTERMTANNLETFLFILFLLCWAVAASAYVLREGLADPDRDRFKLFLNCVMILTSVVPPELPMELTIAVNASLVALARLKVFCTEPFRIPLAGKVTTCCFDKTGTLTTDHMELEGVAGVDGKEGELVADAKMLPPAVVRVLACCQSLVQVERSLVGDPVERASIQAAGWSCKGDSVTGPTAGGRESVHIMHRFHFTSSLKRMSTVVKVESAGGSTSWFVLTKGAPEVVAKHLAVVPRHYEACYKRHAAAGGRVLALAYKELPKDLTPSALRHMPRDEAEGRLRFAGFAVFRSPLKPDSEPALRMLRFSGHQLVMITGDAPLTACHAASHVHIVTRPPLILTVAPPGPANPASSGGSDVAAAAAAALTWRSPDGSVEEPFDPEVGAACQLADDYDLCVTGDGLVALQAAGAAASYIPYTQVFARVTPEQKELVVKTLRAEGLVVLMCGDGTNDVGALKGAHVGVALLPPPPPAGAEQQAAGATVAVHAGSKRGKGGRQGGPSGALALPPRGSQPADGTKPGTAAAPPVKLGPGAKMVEDLRRQGRPVTPLVERMAKMMDEASNVDDGEAPMVRPGDASMASPFTAKDPSVMPCLDILRQGRCTLVTTVQMFKILGLLSLSTAYSLSVLYLDGIKLGDLQATMAGVLTAGMFFFISHAKPLPALSRQRPHPNIFSRYVFTSLLGQFVVHMAFLMFMQQRAHAFMLPEDRQLPDAEFKPNLINTVCFLANFAIQTMTFSVNYMGKPFNTPLAENTMFAMSVRWSVAMFVLLSLDVVPGLASWFSLLGMPAAMKLQMVGLGWLAFAVCTGIERAARAAFPASLPPEKGGMRGDGRGRRVQRLKAA